MDEEEKKEERKAFRKKVKRYITFLSCLLVVCLTALYLSFLLSHKDSNRNTHVNSSETNIGLIEKNLIDGFKDAKETGKYSFRLSNDDINQILLNSCNDLLWDHASSIYVEDNLKVCIDIKRTLGVDTRAIFYFNLERITTNHIEVYKISERKMGKLTYIKNHINLTKFTKELSKRSNLPIVYDQDTRAFIVDPLKILEYFPNTSVKGLLQSLINAKPECLSFKGNTFFDFDIDLSMFNSDASITKEISEVLPDIEQRLSTSITGEFISSIASEESKKACSFSIKELNKLIESKLTILEKEHIESEFTSAEVDIGVEDIYLSLIDSSHIYFVEKLSINGYVITFTNNASITLIDDVLEMNIDLNAEVCSGGVSFPYDSEASIKVIDALSDVLYELSNTYTYLKYLPSSTLLRFDFDYISDEVIEFAFCVGSISVNTLDPKGFDVIITKIY